MSVETIVLALHHSKAPTPLARLVLIGIANHDGDGGAWPSLAKLAKYTGVSTRSVRSAIRALEAVGEIVTHRNEGGGGKVRGDHKPNLYEIVLCCPETCDGSKHHRPREEAGFRPSDDHGRKQEVEREEAGGRHGRKQASAETSLETSVETSSKPAADPADQPVALVLVGDPEPTVNQRAKSISDRYWSWWKNAHGGEEPLTPFLAVKARVKECIVAGWPDAETVKALARCEGTITRAALQRARQAFPAKSGPAQWDNSLVTDGGVGFVQREPGKSRKLTGDEIRRQVKGLDESGVGHG